MERRLRAQFERLLVETVDCADGDAAGALRARLAANVAEGLEEESRAASSNVEDDAEDLARAAAYLDSRLAGSEREAFLASLAARARRRADLASVVALLGAIEVEPKTVPAELSARASSVFAARAVHGRSARPMLAWRNRAIGWSLATLTLLIFVPGALVVGSQVDWPFHTEALLQSLGAPAPGRLEQPVPAAAPIDPFKLKADAPTHEREPPNVARSAPQLRPCQAEPAARADERPAGLDAESAMRSSSHTVPCPPPVGAADRGKMLDATRDSEHGAAAVHRSIPVPSAILPSAR